MAVVGNRSPRLSPRPRRPTLLFGASQIIFFSLLLITGISLTPYVELGLDQSIALPQDSYLIPYFVDQATLLKVGAPVYFVIGGNNVTTHTTQAQHCASFGKCADLSVPTTIVLESQRPEYSTISMRPSLWIDDYITWLNPEIPYTRWYASRLGRARRRGRGLHPTNVCKSATAAPAGDGARFHSCRVRKDENGTIIDYCQADEVDDTCLSCYTADEYKGFDGLGPTGA